MDGNTATVIILVAYGLFCAWREWLEYKSRG